MAEAIEYAARLADTIGARPAGTEEEQQASFFIEEVLRDEAGLPTDMEEFNCNLNFELPRTVCCVATAVLGILSIFLPLMVVPSVIITAITAVLFILDMFDRSLFARLGNSGISQNILARYTPQTDAGTRGRKRKVVLISHYDSGKVRTEAKGGMLTIMPYIYIAEIVGMVLVPLALLIRLITSATAGLLTALNVITIIGVVVALLPVIGFLVHQTAQYNKGANVNAAGISVMLECAKRIREEPDDLLDDILMSGEEQLREQGLIPKGASLTYEEDALPDGEGVARASFDAEVAPAEGGAPEALAASAAGFGAEAGAGAPGMANVGADGAVDAAVGFAGAAGALDALAAANAAPAGSAVSGPSPANGMSAANDVAGVGDVVEIDQRAAYSAAVSQGISEPEPEEDPNVPDWYRKAMKKAKHEEDDSPVHRSRFADALDTANAVSAQAAANEPAQSEAERRLAQMRASIMGEAGAPGVATAAAAAAHQHTGVDGYLSSMTEAQSYEEAATAPAVAAATAISATAVPAASGIPVSQADAQAAAQAAAEAAAAAAATAAAAQAATDKTLSFIPVEVDTEAILRENAELKSGAAGAGAGAGAGAAGAKAHEATTHTRKKRSISLPSLTGAIEGVNARLQNAPLAEAEEEEPSEEKRVARRQARQEKLAASLPYTDSQELPETDKTQAINAAGSFVSPSATSTFEPLGDELVADVAEEDMYIDDADDSDYASEFTATGAPAGAGYVEMPKSRAARMFRRFRRKKQSEDVSMSEAYGLDEQWDARSAGAARGGWESFREDDIDEFDDDEWDGGAFSKVRQMAGRATGRGAEDAEGEAGEEEASRSGRGSRSGRSSRASRSNEEASPRRSRRTENPFGDIPLTSMPIEEREIIQQFHSGAISCEVWFLAVGAELANNAGIKSFLTAHADELKGAVVIDLDGLGAGELSLIEEDGTILVKKPNARLKRYVNKAASTLGLKLGRGKMRWRNSGAYCTAARGLQTLHIAGMQDGKPAYGAQADDVLENLSEEALDQNTAFVLEVLRQI